MTTVPPAADAAEPQRPDDPSQHTRPATIAADFRQIADFFDAFDFELAPVTVGITLQIVSTGDASEELRRQTIDALSMLMSGRHSRYHDDISHHTGGYMSDLPGRTRAYAFGKVGPSAIQREELRQAAAAETAAHAEAELQAAIVRGASFVDVDSPATGQCPSVWYGGPCPGDVVGDDGKCATHTADLDAADTAELPVYVPEAAPTGDAANHATAARLNAAAARETRADPTGTVNDYAGGDLLAQGEVTQPERELLESLYREGTSELATHQPETVSGLRRAGLVCLQNPGRLIGARPRFKLTGAGAALAADLFADLPIPYEAVDPADADAELAALVAVSCRACGREVPAGRAACPNCTYGAGA